MGVSYLIDAVEHAVQLVEVRRHRGVARDLLRVYGRAASVHAPGGWQLEKRGVSNAVTTDWCVRARDARPLQAPPTGGWRL